MTSDRTNAEVCIVPVPSPPVAPVAPQSEASASSLSVRGQHWGGQVRGSAGWWTSRIGWRIDTGQFMSSSFEAMVGLLNGANIF